MPGDPLRDWKDKDPLSAAHLNEVIAVVRKHDARSGIRVSPPLGRNAPPKFAILMGKVVTAGPSGEADFTDERYWVKPQFAAPGGDVADPIAADDLPPLQYEYGEDIDAPDPASNIVCVTNLAELAGHTHVIPVGQYIAYYAVDASTEDTYLVHYLTWLSGSPGTAGGAIAILKITGTFGGGGKYIARVMSGGNAAISDSATALEVDLGSPGGTDVMFINLMEIGGGHAIGLGGSQVYFPGTYAGLHPLGGGNFMTVYAGMAIQTVCGG